MTVRSILFWLHRTFGLALLVFLFLAGLSGAVLTLHEPLDVALNPDLFRVPQVPGGTLQSPAGLADMVQQRMPQLYVVMTPMKTTPGRALVMGVAPRGPGQVLSFDQLFVNPQDGRIVGMRMNRPGWDRRHILQGVLIFHGNLLLGTFGRSLMGGAAIGWLLLSFSGLILSLPTGKPLWQRWKVSWRINLPGRGVKWPRFWFDSHRAGGLWLMPGLLVLALTAAEINFYEAVFLPVCRTFWQPVPSPFDPGMRHVSPDHHTPLTYAITARWAQQVIAHEHQGWQPAFANYFPTLGLYGISFVPSTLDTYAALGPVAYYYDDRSGKLVYRDDPYHDGMRGIVMRSLYPLHSGRIGGWSTEILVGCLGFFTMILSASGLYLWERKRRGRRRARF